ncbi:uncharacterized protein [Montipora foliosa]|uniref:uncharacterized protein n=1 Tax=Montipora foliosa TaxID=591990 RepID=UPI0035F13B8B
MPPSLSRMKQEDSNHSLGNQLTNVLHQPGCSDPNCFLPACINVKLLKSHAQRCKKNRKRCDICKQLPSGEEDQGLSMGNTLQCTPPANAMKDCDMQPRSFPPTEVETQNTDDEISIIRIVRVPESPKKDLQPSQQFQNMVSCNTAAANPNCLDYGSCNAVIPRDKMTVTAHHLQHQGQQLLEQSGPISLQIINNLKNETKPACSQVMLPTSSQVMIPRLEVLCKALQALTTVIQLVKSYALEMHAIPLLEQALAEMKVSALTHLDCNAKPTTLPIINTSVVMEYCESDKSREESEGLPLSLPQTNSSLSPSPSSSAGLIKLECLSPTIGPPSPDVPSNKGNTVEDLYEGMIGEIDVDPEDVLLDFVEELLGSE